MMFRLFSFGVGFIFGIGLCISGMTQPKKVLGFLDLAGAWDPSLAFVMGGALLVGLAAFLIGARRGRSPLGGPMSLPPARPIDRPLIVGSVIFGVGWGVAGLCPGPALVNLGFLDARALAFVVAMLAGMAVHRLAAAARPQGSPVPQDA